ncbi:RDD family protein [Candidatus Woesearchaeota archaeon]|nr:RDD family protein [Candidatus Woesearchaeota archaeon]
MKAAGNWKRFFAFLVDLAIVEFIITKPLNKIITNSIYDFDFSLVELSSFSFKIIFVSLSIGIIGILYWAVLEYKIGQTLGALIFNLRARSEKGSLSFGKSFLRNLSKVSIAFLLIDSINIFFNEKKQRFLERYSGTITVQGEKT